MKQTMDMTQGKPLGLLVRFAVPMLLANICQELYAVADSAVVGRFLGVDAFAAVGAAGTVSWMAIDIILGFTQGFGILYAQRFGAQDFQGLRRGIAMSLWLGFGLGFALTFGGFLGAESILKAIQTPAELLPDTLIYLHWIFGGMWITMAYNMAATLLRALGNSRAPLVAVIISSFVNVGLDVAFVALFHWGVAGVASATLLAQSLSCLYCLYKLYRIPHARPHREDFRFSSPVLRELLRLGTPLGFRNGVISVGGLFVQWAINGYGTLFVAGTSAAKKYLGILQLVAGALDGAFATFSAQNYGAGRLSRIRDGLRCVRRMAWASSLAAALLTALLGKWMIRLLVTGSDQEMQQVIQIGYENLLVIGVTLPLLYLLYLYRSGLQGMGSTLAPMLSGFVELGLRLLSVGFLPGILDRWGIYLADPLGWVGAFLLLCCSYYYVYRKREKEQDQ